MWIFKGIGFGREIFLMNTAPINQPRKLGQFYVAMITNGYLEKDIFLERIQKLSDDIASEPRQSKKSDDPK
tara:strand:+ start:339 stop:551 length:213 start_codon:yes stop_codon:yes gene_type:complete